MSVPTGLPHLCVYPSYVVWSVVTIRVENSWLLWLHTFLTCPAINTSLPGIGYGCLKYSVEFPSSCTWANKSWRTNALGQRQWCLWSNRFRKTKVMFEIVTCHYTLKEIRAPNPSNLNANWDFCPWPHHRLHPDDGRRWKDRCSETRSKLECHPCHHSCLSSFGSLSRTLA